MTIKQIGITQNGNYDLTSTVEVFRGIPSVALSTKCFVILDFGDGSDDLDSTGGTFELTIEIGGIPIQPSPQLIVFDSVDRAILQTPEFIVPVNGIVTVKAKSPNLADSDIDINASLYSDIAEIETTKQVIPLVPLTLPSGFTWNPDNIQLYVGSSYPFGGDATIDYPTITTGITYYADSTIAVSGTGLTYDSPKKTIAEIVTLVNAQPENAKIYLTGAFTDTWGFGGPTFNKPVDMEFTIGSTWTGSTSGNLAILTNSMIIRNVTTGGGGVFYFAGSAGLKEFLVAYDCTFTGSTTAGIRSFGEAETYLVRCVAHSNGTDGFSWHDDSVGVEYQSMSYNNGSGLTHQASTLHNQARVITIGGNYTRGGQVIRDIQSSQRLILNTRMSGAPIIVSAVNDSRIWVYGCDLADDQETPTWQLQTTDNGQIYFSGDSSSLTTIGTITDIGNPATELRTVLSSGIASEPNNKTLIEQLKTIVAFVEHKRDGHAYQPVGNTFFVDPINGDTHTNGNRGGITDPYSLIQDCHDNAITDSNHDTIILLSGDSTGETILTEDVILTKRYMFIRGPGRDFIWTRSGSGDTITLSADGIQLSGFQIKTAATGSGNGIVGEGADSLEFRNLWINNTRRDGIELTDCNNAVIEDCNFQEIGASGTSHGIEILGSTGQSCDYARISRCNFHNILSDGVHLDSGGSGTVNSVKIDWCVISQCVGDGINISNNNISGSMLLFNSFSNISGNNIQDSGTNTTILNNEQWAKTGGLGGSGPTVEDIRIEMDSNSSQLALISDIPTSAEFNARTLLASEYFDPITDTVANVTLVDTTTNNSDMRGTDSANTVVSDPAGTAAALHSSTDSLISSLNNISVADILSDGIPLSTTTGSLDVVNLVNTTTTNTDMITSFSTLTTGDINASLVFYDGPTNTEMLEAFTEIKGVTWSTTDTLESIRDRGDAAWITGVGGGGGGSGTGPNIIGITINDGTNQLENVQVFAYLNGILQATGITGPDGQLVTDLSLVSGSHIILTEANGFYLAPQTLVVTASNSVIYSMERLSINPSPNAATVTAYIQARNESGIVSGITASASLHCHPLGTGIGFVPTQVSGVTDAAGLFQFEAYKGGVYILTLGGFSLEVSIPDTASDPYELKNRISGETLGS